MDNIVYDFAPGTSSITWMSDPSEVIKQLIMIFTVSTNDVISYLNDRGSHLNDTNTLKKSFVSLGPN